MSDAADEGVLVAFEYIERHQRAWGKTAAELIGEIARLLRSLECQQVTVGYLVAILRTHEHAIDFTRDRADEGVEVFFNIARSSRRSRGSTKRTTRCRPHVAGPCGGGDDGEGALMVRGH